MSWKHRTAADADRKRIDEPWGSLTWLAGEAWTGSPDITVGRVVIRKGMSNPRHMHPDTSEVLYLLRGELEHTVGAQSVRLEAGDTLVIPARVYHNAASVGAEDADMIVSYPTGRRQFVPEARDS